MIRCLAPFFKLLFFDVTSFMLSIFRDQMSCQPDILCNPN